MAILHAIKSNILFEKFGDKGLSLMAKIIERRELPQGTPLFVAGLPGESMFVVESGEVALELRVGDRIVPIATLGPGQHFGQLSVLKPGPRLVGAATTTDSVVLEINRKALLKLHSIKPQTSLKFMLAIVENYAAMTRELAPSLLKMMS